MGDGELYTLKCTYLVLKHEKNYSLHIFFQIKMQLSWVELHMFYIYIWCFTRQKFHCSATDDM